MVSLTDGLVSPVLQDHGGNLREACERYGLTRVVDFSASINPLGHPPGLLEHLGTRWREVLNYPDRTCGELRSAICARFSVEPDGILPGNGSAELIDLALRGTAPTRLILCPPDFGLYQRLAPKDTRLTAVPRVEARGFEPDWEGLRREIRRGDMVVLSNPGNPSGQACHPPELSDLLQACADSGATLAVDEAFADFCPGESLLPALAGHPQLLVFRSLTKFYGIPGLRLGFLVASPDRIRAISELQVPWSVNALAQAAGAFCLGRRAWEAETNAYVDKARTDLTRGLLGEGLRPLPSQANFVLVEVTPPAPGASGLYEALARRGILIRHCGSFGLGERYVRLAVRTEAENRLLVGAVAELRSGNLGSAERDPASCGRASAACGGPGL